MTKKKTSKIRKRIIIASVIFLLIVILGCLLKIATIGYTGEPTRINIPRGATSEQISDSLTLRLGKSYGRRVYTLWRLQKGNPEMARGSYSVEPGTKAISLSRRLKQGRQNPVKFTFQNIRTLDQLASRADARMEFTSEQFLAACDSVLPPLGFKRAGYPAAFLPDTYEFYWTESPENFVKKLADVRNSFWTPERREQAKSLGLTPVEVATIASIVEEETAKSDEKPKVARLYLNRLQKGMKLQADPTVKFALSDFSLRRILGKHLAADSPYNTYLHAGLPPGPIRIPARSAIEAVLQAPKHDYLYMCAKEDFSGYHNFASDYPSHQANARRYQAALNARGIK